MLDLSKKIFLITVVSIYFFSCANISSPTGGPKDEKAPKVVKEKSFPAPNTLNYKEKVVELTFDEDVTSQSIQEQLLITPLEDNPYKVIARRNKVRLEFEKDFSTNTTYTFNFRESIKDITEGNPAQNLIIPFSTGPYIDTLFISGNVSDLFTNKMADGMLVSLYKTGDTLSPFNSKPLYFSKTDAGGNFKIQNIKSGNYDLFAIDDKNKNLKYEEVERIAYQKNLKLDSSISNISLQLAIFDTKAPLVKTVKSTGTTYEIQFNEGIEKALVLDQTKNEMTFAVSRTGKSLFIYNTMNATDSIPVTLQLSDSTGNSLTKEQKIFFDASKKDKDPNLILQYLPMDKKLTPGEIKLSILFNKTPTHHTLSQIKIKEDTTTQNLKLENSQWITPTNLEISKKTKAKKDVVLIVPSTTFYFLDTTNKTDTIKYSFHEEDKVGAISGKVKTTKSNYIIELLDNNYQLIKKLKNPATFSFNYIQPGTYYLRAIEDENNNGKWDTGNMKESRQPEKVYLFKDKIDLRANWEIQDLMFTF